MRRISTCLSLAALSLALVTSAAFGQTITIGTIEGAGSVDVTLATNGETIAGTENDIVFGPELTVAIRTNPDTMLPEPDCTRNAAIGREATNFAFNPPGCLDDAGVDCTSVKALVLSFSNLTGIADGSALYSCNIEVVGGTAPGEYPLGCENPGGSSPDGDDIPTTCEDGSVTVPDVPVAEIAISDATGEIGGTATIDISLNLLDSAAVVVATENEFTFPAGAQPFEAGIDEATMEPFSSCSFNAANGREASNFAFTPAGCFSDPDVACTSAKALVLSFSNLTGIADGAVLYSCDLALGMPAGSAAATSGATTGTFPVVCSAPGTSDPDGVSLTTLCVDGSVTIEQPVPTATPTMIGIARAELVGGIGIDDVEIMITNLSGMLPAAGRIRIDDEEIDYGSVEDLGDDTFVLRDVVRGVNDTDAAAHDAGATVFILSASATPTPTEVITDTPAPATDTPTEVPVTNTPVPTATQVRNDADDDSCAIVAPETSSSGWMLMLPMAGLIWLRRRSR